MTKKYFVSFGADSRILWSKVAEKLQSSALTKPSSYIIEDEGKHFSLPSIDVANIKDGANSLQEFLKNNRHHLDTFLYGINPHASYHIIVYIDQLPSIYYAILISYYLSMYGIDYHMYVHKRFSSFPSHYPLLESSIDPSRITIYDIKYLSEPYKSLRFHQALDLIDDVIATDIMQKVA